MPEKKDFLGSLASQVEAKKRGEQDRIRGIDDFKPKQERKVSSDDYNEYPTFDEVVNEKKKPEEAKPAVPVYTDDNAYSSDGVADSFDEEKFVRYEKPKRTVSLPLLAFLVLLAAAAGVLIWWFFLAAHIEMPDFVGRNISEVSAWARQNEMNASAIATAPPEYSMEYDNGVVIRQSVDPGKKIKKDTPVTLTVSAGPDPDEYVSFPDISSMSLTEIREWIRENKLQKAKITTQYSSTVPDGEVISYEVKNGSESDFTRGTTLNIVGSKGAAPAGQIAVQDFKNKSYIEVESWASGKKINLIRQDVYHDTVASGMVISQSAASGTNLKEGDTFTVVVSKGKGIRIPNLVGYTKEQLAAWQGANPIQVVTKSIYNPAPDGSVISQSIAPNTTVGNDQVLELTISLYLPTLDTYTNQWIGEDYLKLKAWVDEVNLKGGSMQAGQYGDYQYNLCSDKYPKEGTIIAYACENGTSSEGNGCTRPLNLDARIAYTISTGACTERQFILYEENMSSLAAIKTWCESNNITYSIEPEPEFKEDRVEIETTRDGYEWIKQTGPFPIVITEGTVVNIHWGRDDSVPTPEPGKQVILEETNMTDLSALTAWCENNGISYVIDTENKDGLDQDKDEILAVIKDSTGKEKMTVSSAKNKGDFPFILNQGDSMTIRYYNKK